ncbi:DNA-processing protein DprA [Arthrobacter sp. 35W]|uniref:DNA-processing protein DprA n=1 Tax=Arthrobacter sp. 35W TaxID=1132441 RepID=UPI0009DEB0E8|nr:DNA-processing protein DprA [Arthrobacter sp. 35W]
MEPSDLAGLALVRAVGPVDALAIIEGTLEAPRGLERSMTSILVDSGAAGSGWPGLADALGRWRPRVKDAAPERDLAVIAALGGGLLYPEHPLWPPALADLDLAEPIALWVRSATAALPPLGSCVAIVGSRDSTSYGASVTSEMAYALAQRGLTIVSGGAFGIDAQAHRAALTGAGPGCLPTIAVMAGGLDRYYPAGNEDLLRAIAHQGALVAEVPPGASSTRYRFLQRNRIIAALSVATVVVEARWRSGALNTAHHAEGLGRVVAAVPGSVYSANSAGCHRLLREGAAVCVTDAAEVAELAGASGEALVPEPLQQAAIHDGLSVEDLLLFDALPLTTGTTVDKLSVVAGLPPAAVLAGLGRLELMALAQRGNGLWKRRR